MKRRLLPGFLSGMLSVGFGSLVTVVLGMLVLMITARILPAEDLGGFFMAQVVVLFLAEGSSLGIYLALERFYAAAQCERERRRIFAAALAFRLATAAVTAALFLLMAEALLPRLGLGVEPWMIWGVTLWFLVESQLRLFYALHQASFSFRVVGVAEAGSSIANFAVVMALTLGLELGVMGLIAAKIVSRGLALAYAAWAREEGPPGLGLDLAVLGRMLRYGLPLYLNFLFSFTAQRGDTLMIGWLLGTASVAYYEVARRLPATVLQFYEAFRQVYFPYVARAAGRGDSAAVSTLVNRATRLGAYALLLCCLLMLAFGEEILVLLFSETYRASAWPQLILFLGASLIMVESTLGYTLSAIGDSTKPPIINALRSALLMLAYLVLIPAFGVVGAAVASALSVLLVIPLNVWFLRRRGLRIDTAGYRRPLVLAMALALAVVPAGAAAGSWAPAAELAVVLLYLPAALVLGAVTREEWRALRAFVRGASIAT